MYSSLARSTVNGYSRAWGLFRIAMNKLNIAYRGNQDLPLTEYHILLFIGALQEAGYAPTSMVTYVSALGFAHKFKGFADPTSSFKVQKVLAAAIRLRPSMDNRLPITLNILSRLNNSLQHTVDSPYLRVLFKAMFIVSFFGLMRMGEVTQEKSGEISLFSDQIVVYNTHAVLKISHFKHNYSGTPFEIVLPRQQDTSICPVWALQNYFNLRGLSFGPLFCYPNLTPISRELFSSTLKRTLQFCGLDTTVFQTHSFRTGAASYYASLGLNDEKIRMLGRWKTTAFRRYIRCQRLLAAVTF